MMQKRFQLPQRPGARPETSHPSRDNPTPHAQVSQNAPPPLQDSLFERVRSLPGVTVGKSLVSVPGARAFHLEESLARGPDQAFQKDREFAHLHPPQDGSLHLTLPPEIYQEVLDKDWGEPHPISGTMMIWGPRDEAELDIIWKLLQASYGYATGKQQL